MIIRKVTDAPAFTAGDNTEIREILHPKNDPVSLNYSLAHASLQPGEASLPHVLRERSEVYFILAGKGRVHIDGEERGLETGELVFIPAGAEQFIENTGADRLDFLCIVSPPWAPEDEFVGAHDR